MSKDIEILDLWECEGCDPDVGYCNEARTSLNSEFCPCPKSSCDAKVIGKVKITTEIIRNEIWI